MSKKIINRIAIAAAVLIVLSVIAGGVYYYKYFRSFRSCEPSYLCEPSVLTPDVKDPTEGFSTYRDGEDYFFFRYPANWSIGRQASDSSDNLIIKDENGKTQIYFTKRLRNLTYDYEYSLEKFIKSVAGGEYLNVEEVENIEMRKIISDNQTLGYFSKWKIYSMGKVYIETRADFESVSETPNITPTGKYKTVYSLMGEDIYRLNLIATTFHFTK